MSLRLALFEAQANHPMNGKLFKKLRKQDLEECRDFIQRNDHLDRDSFAFIVNRWGVDFTEKNKNQATMWALVSQSNLPKQIK